MTSVSVTEAGKQPNRLLDEVAQSHESVQIAGRHWSAVVTYRDDRIRIISVRRSREEEVKIYES